MDYAAEDALYPHQARKVRKARTQYVERGFADLRALASIVGLNPEYLKRRADDEKWEEVRFQFLSSQSTEASDRLRAALEQAGDDQLARHSALGHELMQLEGECALALINAKDQNDFKFLGAKIAMTRDLAEAYQRTLGPLREALGLGVGQPSFGAAREGREVQYKTAFTAQSKATAEA